MNETKRTGPADATEWIDGNSAAAILGVASATLRKWVRDGKIRPRRFSTKYSRMDIERIRKDGTGDGGNA
tara:strand:- start:1198 stop:1407 length:210 start_codon:yes stop_codon:yes gene_type:complete